MAGDERRNLLEDAFHASVVGLFFLGPDGLIEDVNPAGIAMSGSSREALIGFNLLDAQDRGLLPKLQAALRGEASTTDTDYRSTTGGRSGYYRTSFRPHPAPGGGFRVLMMVEDLGMHRTVEKLELSASDLQMIVDNMTDVFYRTDADGTICMASKSCQRVFGLTVEEALGRNALEFYANPDDRSLFLARMDAGNGSVDGFDTRMKRADGQVIWVSTASHFLYDATGAVVGIEGIIRDITERKRTEAELANGSYLVQALLDASSDATMLFDLDGTLLALNSVMAKRFKKQQEDVIGTSLWDMFPPDVAAKRKVAVQQVVATGEAVHFVDVRDDTHLDNHIYPVTDALGVVDKVAVFSRDITDQVRNERRINEYIAEIERSNAELEQFAYVASHDLREPMRMIGSYVDLLGRRYADHLDEDAQAYIAYARSGVSRLNRIVLDLLEYSRIGRVDEVVAPVNMGDVARAAANDLAGVISEVGAQVLVDPDMPVRSAEVTQIEQVYRNLISNAVKYRRCDVPLVIRIGWQAETNVFYVSDNGEGIAPEFFDRIFLLFQRLDSGWHTEGTGIGLAICKKVAEWHGGRIWVESVPGAGSTFYFTIPASAEA